MRRFIRRLVADLTDEIGECSVTRRYGELRPNWVLMDIEVEAVNGLTATRQLKAHFPKARILIVTNYDDTSLRNAAQAASASGYLLKDNLWELRQWFAVEIARRTTNSTNLP